ADGMAAGLEPARRVDRQVAAQPGHAAGSELPALAGPGEPQVLVVDDLGDREAVVALGDVDLAGRVADAGHGVGGPGRLAGGLEGGEAPAGIELRVPV